MSAAKVSQKEKNKKTDICQQAVSKFRLDQHNLKHTGDNIGPVVQN